jgi:hypothetical protein
MLPAVLTDGNIHRIFVAEVDVDADGNKAPCVPDTVITQRDVLRTFMSFAMTPQKVKDLIRKSAELDEFDMYVSTLLPLMIQFNAISCHSTHSQTNS